MKKFISKFSNLARVISIVVIVAIIMSLLMLTLAHDEEDYSPEHIEASAQEAEVIVTPAPPPPEAESTEHALPDGEQPADGSGSIYEAQQPEPEPASEGDISTGERQDEELHIIAFLSRNGDLLETREAQEGDTVSRSAPVIEGYAFEGWSLPDGRIVQSFVVSSDKVVLAIYSQITQDDQRLNENHIDDEREDNVESDCCGDYDCEDENDNENENDQFDHLWFLENPDYIGIAPMWLDPGGPNFGIHPDTGIPVCQGCGLNSLPGHVCPPIPPRPNPTPPPGGDGGGDSGGGGGGTWTPPPSAHTYWAYCPSGGTFSSRAPFNTNWNTPCCSGASIYVASNSAHWNRTPPTPTRPGHTFVRWGGSHQATTRTRIQCAVWRINQHHVRFQNYNGAYLGTRVVNWSSAAAAPGNPARYGHTFAGWNTPFNNVRSDITVTALHVPNPYNVIFENYDGGEHDRQIVLFGSSAERPDDPVKYGHTFYDWDVDDFTVTVAEDLFITAQYVPNLYDVVFLNYDNTEHHRVPTYFGESANAPATPVRPGHNFTSWDTDDFTIRTEDNLIVRSNFTIHCSYPGGCNEEEGLCNDCGRCETHCNCCAVDGCDRTDLGNCGRCPEHCICPPPEQPPGGDGSNSGNGNDGGDDSDTNNNDNENTNNNENNNNNSTTAPPSCRQPGCEETEGLCPDCGMCEEHCTCCVIVNCKNPADCDDCGRCSYHCMCVRWVTLIGADGTTSVMREIDVPPIALADFRYTITPLETPPLFTLFGRPIFLWADWEQVSWALVNLLLAVAGVVLAIINAIPAIKRKRIVTKNQALAESEIAGANFDKSIKWFIIGAVLSIVSPAVFALTQNLTAMIALLDFWTIAHVMLIIAQIVLFKIFWSRQTNIDMPDEDTEKTEVTEIS